MDIFGRMLTTIRRYRQARAEREALRLLIERRDDRLLRDAGMILVEAGKPHCEPLPQMKERRWTAPLIRLLPPPLRRRGKAESAPVAQDNDRYGREKPAA